MTDPLEFWPAALVLVAALGIAPGLVLRLVVCLYPKDHSRRRELLGELYAVEYRNRPLFVGQHCELALFEGIPARWRAWRQADSPAEATEAPVDVEPVHVTPRFNVGFRGPLVCEIVGITFRQLDYWARTDLLRPSISQDDNGTRRTYYSYRDLLELEVIKRLLDGGISLQSARRALDALRHAGEGVGSANLAINGSAAVLVQSGEEIIDLLREAKVLQVLSLQGVVAELDLKICGLSDRLDRGQEPDLAG